jgi:predicted nucleic acid-binding Zn ribbon protein
MKYVRMKSGEIDIMKDGDSIPADAETIFSTEPSVYEGTWDNGVKDLGKIEGPMDTPDPFKKHADVVVKSGKMDVQDKEHLGDIPRETSYIGTKEERQKTGYDPERKLREHQKLTGWKGVHKPHPEDKVCLNCGKVMKGVRPNRKFCSEKCKNTYGKRQRRAQAREVKQFKPHMGKEGQIYYMINGKISFVPALWSDSKKRATKYVTERYEGKELEDILEQVKEVMGK